MKCMSPPENEGQPFLHLLEVASLVIVWDISCSLRCAHFVHCVGSVFFMHSQTGSILQMISTCNHFDGDAIDAGSSTWKDVTNGDPYHALDELILTVDVPLDTWTESEHTNNLVGFRHIPTIYSSSHPTSATPSSSLRAAAASYLPSFLPAKGTRLSAES